MSNVTKIFVILTMLAAVAAGIMSAMTFAQRENWKARWAKDTTELASQLKSSNQTILVESAARVRAEQSLTTFRTELDASNASCRGPYRVRSLV